MNFSAKIFTFFLLFSLAFVSIKANLPTDYPAYNKLEVKPRVQSMHTIVQPKYTTVVEAYIKGYTMRNREKSERILGRAVKYFPMFEKYLKEAGLPDDLKYLSVVESALVPKAVSRVGAGGLWQFMPATGESYGLKINRYVDDRSCPHKSTQAAMKHLTSLYKRFQNWELALAAYNSGGGRVNRAVKMARSKNFWKVQKYLPRETRNYVPAFIAATYLYKYYNTHELSPIYPDLDLQLTESMRVYDYLSFQKIEEVTGLSRYIVEELNPSYDRGFIPSNYEGNYLTLPKRVMPSIRDFFRLKKPDAPQADPMEVSPVYVKASVRNESKSLYFKSLYTIARGDDLELLAKVFSCTPNHLMFWNRLTTSALTLGQELTVYYPTEIVRYRPRPVYVPVAALPLLPIKKIDSSVVINNQEITIEAPKQQFTDYRLKRYESLLEVAEKYKNVTVKNIMEWNGFSRKDMPSPGDNLLIRNAN
ncbi:MAG: membrane-bound lytic murein transglycosylase D [Paraglaciecola sp.]|jgi:membrane-bound lytic murein transglycosylase D